MDVNTRYIVLSAKLTTKILIQMKLFPLLTVTGLVKGDVVFVAVETDTGGSLTTPIALRIAGTAIIAPGGTCFASSVKLSVIFSAEKKKNIKLKVLCTKLI